MTGESESPTALPWRQFAQAPLMPIALATIAGLMLDRYFTISLEAEFTLAILGIVGWLASARHSQHRSIWLLALGFAGLSAAHHHTHRHSFPVNDIANWIGDTPQVAHVRGFVDDPPITRRPSLTDLFGPVHRVERISFSLTVSHIRGDANLWQPVAGRIQVNLERVVEAARERAIPIQVGDEVEVIGRLARPGLPGNPNEWDYAAYCQDERIRAELHATKSDAAIIRLDTAGRRTAWLAQLRGYFTRQIESRFSSRTAALARALLLGDGSAMDRDEWDVFMRTGVIHVLAISGQHLVILAGFVWWALRLLGTSRKTGAILVLSLVFGYSLLTGLRPSAVRATVMVGVVCLALLLHRPVHSANAFALGGITIAILNPVDLFTSGCQLSFLSVFVLIWGMPVWFRREPSRLESLLEESLPWQVRLMRELGRIILLAYLLTLVLTLVNAPLIMARQNVISPVGILIGPILVFLTAIALLAGFLFLIIGSIPPLTSIIELCLRASDSIAEWADRLPGASLYTPTPSPIWVVVFYGLLVAFILLADRRFFLAILIWVCLGLVGLPRGATDELRVTFLAVGHGGCTVLELPDGRVLLYDAGTMSGSDSVRRVIAPFLWHRGISRIDELFLSHADLDHFNGVPELLKRFRVGQATLTPSFALKPTAEVAEVLLSLERHRVPSRVAITGDRFEAGEVSFEVLHPSREHLAGSENERSLVLRVAYRGRSILLTGDLEKAGTRQVLQLPTPACDVLMAPHHGSRTAFSTEVVTWAKPRFVVVSRGNRSDSAIRMGDAGQIPIWDTASHGAITIRLNPTGVVAEMFRTGERVAVLPR